MWADVTITKANVDIRCHGNLGQVLWKEYTQLRAFLYNVSIIKVIKYERQAMWKIPLRHCFLLTNLFNN